MAREASSAHRREKIDSQLKQELALIVAHEVKDPRLSMVTVISVACAPDLSFARIRVSVLDEEPGQEAACALLQRMAGFLRHRLGEHLPELRRIPRLEFVLDRSITYAIHVSGLLNEIGQERRRRDQRSNAG